MTLNAQGEHPTAQPNLKRWWCFGATPQPWHHLSHHYSNCSSKVKAKPIYLEPSRPCCTQRKGTACQTKVSHFHEGAVPLLRAIFWGSQPLCPAPASPALPKHNKDPQLPTAYMSAVHFGMKGKKPRSCTGWREENILAMVFG